MTHQNRNILQKFRKNNFKKKIEKNYRKIGSCKLNPISTSASDTASGVLKIAPSAPSGWISNSVFHLFHFY